MFKVLFNSIKFSFLGILKVSLTLLFVGIAAVLVLNSNNTAAYSVSSISGLFSSAGKINQLNTQLVETIPSADLNKLDIQDITPEEAEIFLFILKLSNSITPPEARKLAKVIVDECSTYELDPYLILAVIQTESNFTPKAVSPRGAVGLMQVMPKTGEYVAKDRGLSYKGISSLYDPFLNVKLGIHYLSFLTDQFDSVENALAAYNYGPSKFANSKTLAENPPKYVRKVLNFKSFLEEESILLAKNS